MVTDRPLLGQVMSGTHDRRRLDAALSKGIVHRDIKRGTFCDARATAKIWILAG